MKLRFRHRRGTILILTGLFLLAGVTVGGVAFDLSRFLLVSKGLRAKAEAGATAAALELDGSAAGLERAISAARDYAGPNARVRFGNDASGHWEDSPATEGALFARVDVGVDVAMPLSSPATGRRALPARASAIAGQAAVDGWDSGLYPYALEDASPVVGQRYNLSYYEEPLARTARAGVLSGYQSAHRKLGDVLPATAAPVGEASLAAVERVNQDSDAKSDGYASYAAGGRGNGRRLVAVPVVDSDRKMTGVAALLLAADGTPDTGEVAGGFMQASRWRAAAGTGFHAVRQGERP